MKELEDYTWFPNILRRWQMEFIGWTVFTFHIYKGLIPFLDAHSKKAGVSQLYDLCSGTGEPVKYIMKHGLFKHATLTDKFPQSIEHTSQISYNPSSIDVLNAEFPSNQLITMFNAFHHFDETEQFRLLERVTSTGRPFFFVEILQPKFIDFIKIGITTSIGQVLFAPFIRPFSWTRLLFTYLIPINLLTVTYDGLVSVLKSGSIPYYTAMVKNLPLQDFELNVSEIESSWGSKLVVISGCSTMIND